MEKYFKILERSINDSIDLWKDLVDTGTPARVVIVLSHTEDNFVVPVVKFSFRCYFFDKNAEELTKFNYTINIAKSEYLLDITSKQDELCKQFTAELLRFLYKK